MEKYRFYALLGVTALSLGILGGPLACFASDNQNNHHHRPWIQDRGYTSRVLIPQNPAYGINQNYSNANQGYNQGSSWYPNYAAPPMPVWQLSKDGGYYDSTGNIKTVVPGSELWRYGGVFFDGVPAPTGPVPTNFAGHVLSH